MANTVADLVRHFENIYVEHMQELPIVNTRVQVEAVGFHDFRGDKLGVLITPWFMNLVLLPAGARWDECAQGDTSSVDFVSGKIEFTVARDEILGTYLTAVLLRSVADISDQSMAREIARQVLKELFVPINKEPSLSRRELLTGLWAR